MRSAPGIDRSKPARPPARRPSGKRGRPRRAGVLPRRAWKLRWEVSGSPVCKAGAAEASARAAPDTRLCHRVSGRDPTRRAGTRSGHRRALGHRPRRGLRCCRDSVCRDRRADHRRGGGRRKLGSDLEIVDLARTREAESQGRPPDARPIRQRRQREAQRLACAQECALAAQLVARRLLCELSEAVLIAAPQAPAAGRRSR